MYHLHHKSFSEVRTCIILRDISYNGKRSQCIAKLRNRYIFNDTYMSRVSELRTIKSLDSYGDVMKILVSFETKKSLEKESLC